MADDIEELLDEVESKFPQAKLTGIKAVIDSNQPDSDEPEEISLAIHSLSSLAGTVDASSGFMVHHEPKKSCSVIFVGDDVSTSGSSTQKTGPKRNKHSHYSKHYRAKQFSKPMFEISAREVEVENTRRRQKELLEKLFEQKQAEVTDKMILDARKFKRIKSDVWFNFGDVRFCMDELEVKKLDIDYHKIRIGETDVLLCKAFVACVKCFAVFSYESHSYGTSTLRAHLKSCGKQRSKINKLKNRGPINISSSRDYVEKSAVRQRVLNFQDHTRRFQEQILLFSMSKLTKPASLIDNAEFKDLLQTFIQIGATVGNVEIKNYVCAPNELEPHLEQDVYVKMEEAFKNEVQFLYGLSFSINIWLDKEKNSYVTFSCHYSNEKGNLKSVMFHTSEFPYMSKTPDDMYNLFQQCVEELNTDFKRLLVIDYSYNMVHAFHENEQFIQCICYALHCAMQYVINSLSTANSAEEDQGSIVLDDPMALPSFVLLISQCQDLVSHFKVNKLQNSLPKTLVLCNTTNWKIVLDMLESINSQWDHIISILVERNESHKFPFDHELLSLIVDFFEIFRDGYTELSSLTSPTLNLVLPWVTKWKMHCFKNEDEAPLLATLKSFMSCAIDQEVVKRLTIQHKLATMLDPRYKDLQFLSTEDSLETRMQAEGLVKECRDTLILNGIDVHNSMSENSHCEVYDPTNEIIPSTANEEVGEYLAENFVMEKEDLDGEEKFNPLKYWLCAKSRYPYLSRVALWILSCPACAVRNDDVLSAEWMLTLRQTNFPPHLMHKCLFVKSFRGF